jgi:CubicO group peptidase (beta-lactamase class C family)
VSVHGLVAPGFEPVAAAFAENLQRRGDLGAAFAAVVEGELVVDLWGGFTDAARSRPWESDTVCGVYSGTKGLVATCLALLVQRGQLDLDAPVTTYWPEFAQHGKGDVLVRHLVSHHAALPGLTTPITVTEAQDDVRIAGLLARQPALAPPGTRFWYHAMTFGWLCGELIRRADPRGRSVGTFLRDEIALPLGLDLWIGLPEEIEPRVATLVPQDGFGAPGRGVAQDPVAWSIWANPPRFTQRPLPANTRGWHAAEIPASNAIVSARSLAQLYGALVRGGGAGGGRARGIGSPLCAATTALARTELTRGIDPFLDTEMRFGLGFQLQVDDRFGPPAQAFGHGGTGGSVHGAWPAHRTGFSYVMNLLRGGAMVDERSSALLDALHGVVAG